MSEEIDMKSYAGEASDSAAGGQIAVQDSNLVNVHEEAVGNAQERPVQESTRAEEPSRQELNFRALTSEVERIKAERESERREYQLQLELMKANMAPRAEQPPQAPRKMFDGLDDNDIPSAAQIRNEWAERENHYQKQLNDYQGTIQEMQVALSNPDYADVVTKYATPLIKNDPILAQGVHGAENKALYVYRLGKLAQQMEQNRASQPTPQVHPQAQRIVENAKKPGNLGAAGGQSALSQADYYASMSEAEFMKFASRNLEGI